MVGIKGDSILLVSLSFFTVYILLKKIIPPFDLEHPFAHNACSGELGAQWLLRKIC